MLGQQVEIAQALIVAGPLVHVQGEAPLGMDLDPVDAAVELVGLHARLLGAPDLPGEDDVLGGDRLAVAPDEFGLERVGDGHAWGAVGRGLVLGRARLERRQFRAQKTGQRPIRVVGRDGPPRHAGDVGLGQHGIEAGMQGRRVLRDADHQPFLRRGLGGGRREQGGDARESGDGAKDGAALAADGHGRRSFPWAPKRYRTARGYHQGGRGQGRAPRESGPALRLRREWALGPWPRQASTPPCAADQLLGSSRKACTWAHCASVK